MLEAVFQTGCGPPIGAFPCGTEVLRRMGSGIFGAFRVFGKMLLHAPLQIPRNPRIEGSVRTTQLIGIIKHITEWSAPPTTSFRPHYGKEGGILWDKPPLPPYKTPHGRRRRFPPEVHPRGGRCRRPSHCGIRIRRGR